MTILDTTDTLILDSITVLAYPHPSGDSCAIRTFVAALHRDTWQIEVREVVGGKLLDTIFGTFPGPKESPNASLECERGALIVYYSGRVVGDPTGPFQEQVERIEIKDIWPMPDTALARVRNVARILVKHFPDLAGDLAPYVK